MREQPEAGSAGRPGRGCCGVGEDAGVSAGAAGGLSCRGNGENCGALVGSRALLWNCSLATWDALKLANSADLAVATDFSVYFGAAVNFSPSGVSGAA